MLRQSINQFGDIVTLREAARMKDSSADAIRQWLHRHDKSTYRVGKTILVRIDELSSYVPRPRKATNG